MTWVGNKRAYLEKQTLLRMYYNVFLGENNRIKSKSGAQERKYTAATR